MDGWGGGDYRCLIGLEKGPSLTGDALRVVLLDLIPSPFRAFVRPAEPLLAAKGVTCCLPLSLLHLSLSPGSEGSSGG